MKSFKKRFYAVAVTVFVVGVAAIVAVVLFARTGVSAVHAQVQQFPNPSIATISGSGAAEYDITLPSDGPFANDFQIQLCIYSSNGTTNPYVCFTSPLASQSIDGAATGQWKVTASGASTLSNTGNWSEWGWSGSANEMVTQGGGNASITIIKGNPLPAGVIITNLKIGMEISEDSQGQLVGTTDYGNYIWGLPCAPISNAYGQSIPSGEYDPGSMGALFVGGSPYSTDSGQIWSAHSKDCDNAFDPDDARVYMSDDMLDAAGTSNNIPTTFNTSQTVTNGSDGNPLEITVKNTGASAWTSDQSTVIAGSQQPGSTCDGPGGAEPSTSDAVGTSCTVSLSNYSNVFELQHVSGSFGVGSNPAQYSQVSQQTCTVSSTQACSNSSCSDQESCEAPVSGYCTVRSCSESMCRPAEFGGCGGTWESGCGSTWGNSIQCSTTGGDSNVEPGQSVAFKLNSLTAPATPGAYTETWQMEDGPGNPFGSQMPVSITVGNVATTTPTSTTVATGTITVTSEDAVTNGPVNAAWDITDLGSGPLPATDPSILNYDGDVCDWVGNELCHGSSQTYVNQPAVNTATPSSSYGSVTMLTNKITLYNPADSALYSFNSVRMTPIAQKKIGVIDALLSLTKSIFDSTAEAFVLQQPAMQTLTAAGAVNYTILWNPIANIAVSSTNPLSLTSTQGSSTSGQVQISNTGAPGSTLTWTTTSDSSWLTATPSADASGLTNDNSGNDASEMVTINAASQPVGSYTGHITF